MANFRDAARTNYFKVEDFEGLKDSIDPFPLSIKTHPEFESYVCLETLEENGGWPSYALIENEDGDEEEIEFSFEEHVMPFVAENEVLVEMSVGAEKLRYLNGYSAAYVRRGEEVLSERISISSIYGLAAKAFGIPESRMADCIYDNVPDYLMSLKHGRADTLRKLLDEGQDFSRDLDDIWKSAMTSGSMEVLDALVDMGFDPHRNVALFNQEGVSAQAKAWYDSIRLKQGVGCAGDVPETALPRTSFLRRG